jgi:hypothetical protein
VGSPIGIFAASIGRIFLLATGLGHVFGLFLELLMIRWVSSEISVFAYFKNFGLIACFLCFGMGCYLSRRTINLTVTIVPLVTLALTCALPWQPLRAMVDGVPAMIGATSQVNIWDVPELPLSLSTLAVLLAALLFIVPAFALAAARARLLANHRSTASKLRTKLDRSGCSRRVANAVRRAPFQHVEAEQCESFSL